MFIQSRYTGLPPAQRPDDSNEEDNDEDDNEEYYNYLTDDSIDPDEMSYEVCPPPALGCLPGIYSQSLCDAQ